MGKKQPKKRTWRKANLEDVEEALEDERLVAKLKSKVGKARRGDPEDGEDALFTVDTVGVATEAGQGLTGMSRRERARAKIFPTKGPNLGLSAMEEAKVERAERAARSRPTGRAHGPDVFDLWGSADAASPGLSSRRALGKGAQQSASLVRRMAISRPKRVPGTVHEKVGLAPAVLPAHEGQSMNPEGKAFEDLTCTAAAQHLEQEREAEALDRKLRPLTDAVFHAVGAEALKSMDEEAKIRSFQTFSFGSNASGDATGTATAPNGMKLGQRALKRLEQKSQADKNREKKQKNIDALESQRLQRRKLEKSVGDVGALLKELKERGSWEQGRKEYRKALKAKRREEEIAGLSVPKSRKLGRNRFAEDLVAVPDAEAAQRGLRAMPLQVSAARERLSSIVRRGLLPPPAEASRSETARLKRRVARVKHGRRFISPLLRDSQVK